MEGGGEQRKSGGARGYKLFSMSRPITTCWHVGGGSGQEPESPEKCEGSRHGEEFVRTAQGRGNSSEWRARPGPSVFGIQAI